MRGIFVVFTFAIANLFAVCACALTPTPTHSQLLTALKSGGHVLLLRHAQTEPGIGDPPNFRLNDCSTQRNLSEAGRAQSRRIGETFRAQDVRFARTLTSQWCRCRDTARLVSDKFEDFAALNSFFESRGEEPRQTISVKQRLKLMPAHQSWLIVTHQVNIAALTGISPAMGEAVVVRVAGGGWKTLGTLAVEIR